MTYVFPRPQGFRLPGFLARSADQARVEAPPVASVESWTTTAAPVAAYVAVPGVVPLADPSAFRDHLMHVVEVEMGKLTDARAVDEWHREVLDPRISAEVAQQIRRIEQSAHERQTALQGELVATQTGAEQLVAMHRDADEVLQSARAQLSAVRARVGFGGRSDGGAPAPAGDVEGQLASVRSRMAEHRAGIARALDTVKVDSGPQLASELRAADRKVADLDSRVAAQQSLVEAAESERAAALDRFRGVVPADSPAPAVAPATATTEGVAS